MQLANQGEASSTLLASLGIEYLDHLAVTTADLERTLAEYMALPGARLWRGPADNPTQRVRYAFVQITAGLTIEILAPLEGEENSPIVSHLARGGGVYHLCYAVRDLAQALRTVEAQGGRCVVAPVADCAFDGRLIAFVVHPAHGLLELVAAFPCTELAASEVCAPPLPTPAVSSPPTSTVSPRCFRARLLAVLSSLLPQWPAEASDAAMGVTPGWDSLMQLRIVMALEREFACHIPAAQVNQLISGSALLAWGESQGVDSGAKDGGVALSGGESRLAQWAAQRAGQRQQDEARVLRAALRQSLSAYRDKPALIHSDVLQTAALVADNGADDPLAAHQRLLESCPVNWWVPAFNYQFPARRELDLRSAPIEVGALNQYLQRHWAQFRTFEPMFSVLGRGEAPPLAVAGELQAFGEQSVFAELVRQGGAVVMYGAGLNTLTLLHYAESRVGGVPYRYDKVFAGTLTDMHGVAQLIRWRFHARPWGRELDYDWEKVEAVLRAQGVVQPLIATHPRLGCVLDARACVEALCAALRADPLALLDAPSRAWVAPALAVLGRGFVLSDFESE